MKKRLVDIFLIFGTLFLIIFSSIIPLVIGDSYMDLDEKQIDYNLYRYEEHHPLECSINNENANSKDSSNVNFRASITSPVALIDGPMDSPWSMQSHDTHHTGRSPYSTENNLGTEKWRFHFTGWLEDTPVIDSDGTIYCKGAYEYLDRYLYAIYPNGTEKWKFKTDGLILGSSPAIDEDGTIYIGSWDCKLYAINPDGTEKWRFPSGGSIASSPAIAKDGTIYFGTMSSGNSIIAVYPNGTEKWRYTTGYPVTSDPAIGDDGTIYIGSMDNYFYALYPNGTLRWRFETGHYIKGPASIAEDGTIYVGSWDDYLYALYPNGTMKWRYAVAYGTETNPSIASDGTIYVGGWETLWAIYPNGTLRWEFYLGSDRHIHMSSPAISAEGTIYVGTNIGDGAGGEIIAVNSDGTERWRKRIANEWVDSSPSIAEDGTVYIGSAYEMGEGYLHAFGERDNSPPETPDRPTGPLEGEINTDYTYTSLTTDTDDLEELWYMWDWGDGSTSDWIGPYESGIECSTSHTWVEEGNYQIRVKVKDAYSEESDWSEPLSITMPRNKPVDLFQSRFPILAKLFILLSEPLR